MIILALQSKHDYIPKLGSAWKASMVEIGRFFVGRGFKPSEDRFVVGESMLFGQRVAGREIRMLVQIHLIACLCAASSESE